MKGLKNKVAVVSGAVNGLGEAITRRLIEEGCIVAGIDLQAPREALRHEFTESQVRFYQCDIADDPTLADTVAQIASDCGAPSVLVNDAALFLFQELTLRLKTWTAYAR